MEIELKYGKGTVEIQIPDSVNVSVLEPKNIESVPSVEHSIDEALVRATELHTDILPGSKEKQTVAIAIPDETRPLPMAVILPHLLSWLFEKIPDLTPERVNIIVGCGLHASKEMGTVERLVPKDLPQGCHILVHDAFSSPTVHLGTTAKGTPVLINEAFASADYKVVVGQIDPHQIVGFTDSVAGLISGCSGDVTVEHNHSLMFDEAARVGVLSGNPVREDMDEASALVGIDLALDFVLAPNKEVVKVIAGRPVDTLRKGASIAADLYGVVIDKKFDIIVASCGGFPKDVCLYQAQKGLHLASQAVKPGGHILMLAALHQGVGDDIYFDYVSQFTTPDEVVSDFRNQEFKMGAHKAFLFGRTLSEFDVVVHSEMDQGVLQRCLLRAAVPSNVIAEWLEEATEDTSVGIITNANTTYFFEEKDRF